MTSEAHQKVRATHLQRTAYLYIRQSTLRQVVENTESTHRQYDLRKRAAALGWPSERLVVIDCDLGQSGASSVERAGFLRLVADVGMGRAGIVMGLEVSRLARNSTDWHRLLEICALTDTLILDEDGVYDPAYFNDRLLLGLKGTMSEAELHLIRARMRGALLSKAKRGELVMPVPTGFTHAPDGTVVLDPDSRVQESVRLLFATFRRTGTACATVKSFRREGLQFPARIQTGPQRGELAWRDLTHPTVVRTLHNPRYAGAYCYGRTRQRKTVNGRPTSVKQRREDWVALIQGVHPSYISWQQFEENERVLLANAQAQGLDRRQSPPREGPALLQGLAVCGRCGQRMVVHYRRFGGRLAPQYRCGVAMIEAGGGPLCQHIPGTSIDAAVGQLLLETVTPVALEVALAVQAELASRIEDADRLRAKRVDAAQYDANLARRRYLQVDPDNRLVADDLEADWNQKLRILAAARDERERLRKEDRAVLSQEKRDRVLALATDFPKMWTAPETPHRERKRVARLLIEDVTLTKGSQISAQIRFKGGTTRTLTLPIPPPASKLYRTPSALVAEIDRLLNIHHEADILPLLLKDGFRSGEGLPVTRDIIRHIRKTFGLKSRYERLRAAGLLTIEEMAARLCISKASVWRRVRLGHVKAVVYNERGERLFEPPTSNTPVRYARLASA